VYLAKRKSVQRKTMVAKEKPSRVLISLMIHCKQCHHQQQQQMILKLRGQNNCFDRCLKHEKLRTTWTFLRLRWHYMCFLWIGGKFIDINSHALPNLQENGSV